MTIHQGSRYRFKNILQVTDELGQTNYVHKIRKTTLGVLGGSRIYRTKAGDTLEKLAETFYSDSRKWYAIADANPEIFFPLDLDVGIDLTIPPRTYVVVS
jgi:phage tail protein X